MDHLNDEYISTVIESFLMNYDQTNISNTSSKNLVAEVNLIQKSLSKMSTSINLEDINKYTHVIESELQSRITGDNLYKNICIESIQSDIETNYIDNVILPVRTNDQN